MIDEICDTCGGDGQVDCQVCDIDGHVDCYGCSGDGFIVDEPCDVCHGAGGMVICNACEGHRVISCPDC